MVGAVDQKAGASVATSDLRLSNLPLSWMAANEEHGDDNWAPSGEFINIEPIGKLSAHTMDHQST